MKPVTVAIWGLHHQHPRWYWPLFENLPQLRPLCICDRDREFLAGEAEFFGLPAYENPAEMLARPDVEAVMIFLPHREMPEAVGQAVEAGKHVLVEKPMGADLDQVRQVARIADSTRLKVTTGYCWRFDPMARRIKQWISDGLLGRIVHFEGRMTAGGPWRYIRDKAPWMLEAEQGGGPMQNLGVHWIDLFHWWSGLEIVAVQGRATRTGGEPRRTIEDNAYALLEYDNGATGLLDISYSAPPSFPQGRDLLVSIRGTLGVVNWAPSWGGDDQRVLLVSEHESVGDEKVQRIAEPTAPLPGYCGQMGLDYLADFAEAIRRDRPVSVAVADGLRAMRVAEAALKAGETGERVTL